MVIKNTWLWCRLPELDITETDVRTELLISKWQKSLKVSNIGVRYQDDGGDEVMQYHKDCRECCPKLKNLLQRECLNEVGGFS
jgi:hypothetical protein